MTALFLRSKRYPFNRQVVTLRATTNKGNFSGTTMQYLGHLLTGAIYRLHGMSPQCIDAACIAIFGYEIRDHRIQYPCIKWRGSCGIEVNGTL